jgi:hypothetical protein
MSTCSDEKKTPAWCDAVKLRDCVNDRFDKGASKQCAVELHHRPRRACLKTVGGRRGDKRGSGVWRQRSGTITLASPATCRTVFAPLDSLPNQPDAGEGRGGTWYALLSRLEEADPKQIYPPFACTVKDGVFLEKEKMTRVTLESSDGRLAYMFLPGEDGPSLGRLASMSVKGKPQTDGHPKNIQVATGNILCTLGGTGTVRTLVLKEYYVHWHIHAELEAATCHTKPVELYTPYGVALVRAVPLSRQYVCQYDHRGGGGLKITDDEGHIVQYTKRRRPLGEGSYMTRLLFTHTHTSTSLPARLVFGRCKPNTKASCNDCVANMAAEKMAFERLHIGTDTMLRSYKLTETVQTDIEYGDGSKGPGEYSLGSCHDDPVNTRTYVAYDVWDGDVRDLLADQFSATIKAILPQLVHLYYDRQLQYWDIKVENILYRDVHNVREYTLGDLGSLAVKDATPPHTPGCTPCVTQDPNFVGLGVDERQTRVWIQGLTNVFWRYNVGRLERNSKQLDKYSERVLEELDGKSIDNYVTAFVKEWLHKKELHVTENQ